MFFGLIKKIIFIVPLLFNGVQSSGELTVGYHYNHDWIKWKHEYNKVYSSSEEERVRFHNFLENLNFIRGHKSEDYSVNLNHFADLSREEWVNRFNNFEILNRGEEFTLLFEDVINAPNKLDWRVASLNPKGKVAVNPVKNQGQCGSCWAFSTVASVEGAWALAGNTLVSLSEQELVDCSSSEGNQGCNGGIMDQGFQYIIDNKGICSEASYPYIAENEQCKSTQCKNVAFISSYFDIQSMNETAIFAAIQKGPISIAIEADQNSFQFYSGGVYSDVDCGTNLDHGVNLVGYGTDNGKDYWILRNSWGGSWGESGYMRILRGQNICGLSQMPSMPVV